jgi:hypothetical protein
MVARGSGTDGEVGKTGVRRVQRELASIGALKQSGTCDLPSGDFKVRPHQGLIRGIESHGAFEVRHNARRMRVHVLDPTETAFVVAVSRIIALFERARAASELSPAAAERKVKSTRPAFGGCNVS